MFTMIASSLSIVEDVTKEPQIAPESEGGSPLGKFDDYLRLKRRHTRQVDEPNHNDIEKQWHNFRDATSGSLPLDTLDQAYNSDSKAEFMTSALRGAVKHACSQPIPQVEGLMWQLLVNMQRGWIGERQKLESDLVRAKHNAEVAQEKEPDLPQSIAAKR